MLRQNSHVIISVLMNGFGVSANAWAWCWMVALGTDAIVRGGQVDFILSQLYVHVLWGHN
jgi:hypothetical protein